MSVDAGTAPDADTVQIPQHVAEAALDFAACMAAAPAWPPARTGLAPCLPARSSATCRYCRTGGRNANVGPSRWAPKPTKNSGTARSSASARKSVPQGYRSPQSPRSTTSGCGPGRSGTECRITRNGQNAKTTATERNNATLSPPTPARCVAGRKGDRHHGCRDSLMSHDCPVAQLTDATTITHKSVALQ